jgi:hypothetical protein
LHRTVQGMDAAIAVVADVHPPPADRAVTIEDIEFPEGEIGILRPSVRHRADLRAVVRPIDVAVRQELTLRTPDLLAILRTVDISPPTGLAR